MEGEEKFGMKEEPIKWESEMVEEKTASIKTDDEIVQIRKDKIVSFFKKNYDWVAYVFLAFITFLAVRIRTRNLDGLRDVTTGTWTLGPDLDPFLFLRWAKYIVENGKLMTLDVMRYSPLGYDTKGELILHPYLIAWFHKIASIFGSESVTHSAVLYPAFMFGLTVIAFFFMTRKIFAGSMGARKANIIALLSSFFLSVIPSLLPRTIAGIPEKESAAFLFMFLAFYFFLSAWQTKKLFPRYFFAFLAGASTASMALIWGGYAYVFLTIAPTIFICFLLGKLDKSRFYVYGIWLISSFALMSPFSSRYNLSNLSQSVSTGMAIVVFLIILVHFVLFNTKLKDRLKLGRLSKIPAPVISTVATVLVLALVVTLFVDFSFIPSKAAQVFETLVKPPASRLIRTVAESRQPYFTEWANGFGPQVRGIPLTFWLFFFGSIYLFSDYAKGFRKNERRVLTLSYVIFLVAIIFSRYSSDGTFNGENFASILLYSMGLIALIGTFGFYYYQYHKRDEEDKLREISFGVILLFMLFFLSILSARGAVRLIMVLVPPVSIIVSYFAVASFSSAINVEDKTKRIFALGITVIIIISTIFAGYTFYKSVDSSASGYVPSIYTQQWQKAMSWVRDNTPQDSVFGHWWDYGYWVQSIGERATVLDGGNGIGYWNHLMGRHALTGTNSRDALEYLYAHKTTHFLIDSTDIGKYSAFSNIGSDISYDRASYIPTILRDPNQVQEKKNSTVLLYRGGVGLDSDIIYELNGSRVFLPAGSTGLGGVLVERNELGSLINPPYAIYVYQNQQYTLPLRYAFYNGEFLDFGSGIEAGVFIYPSVTQNGEQLQIDSEGAMLYLSERTVMSQLARLYLYKEEDPNFRLVHSEDDLLVSQIKAQQPDFNYDIVHFQGVRGPIRIWEIDYPEDIEYVEEYVSTFYPAELYRAG